MIQTQNRVISFSGNTINSATLFKSEKELMIEHNDEMYRLRITGNGKLILTK